MRQLPIHNPHDSHNSQRIFLMGIMGVMGIMGIMGLLVAGMKWDRLPECHSHGKDTDRLEAYPTDCHISSKISWHCGKLSKNILP